MNMGEFIVIDPLRVDATGKVYKNNIVLYRNAEIVQRLSDPSTPQKQPEYPVEEEPIESVESTEEPEKATKVNYPVIVNVDNSNFNDYYSSQFNKMIYSPKNQDRQWLLSSKFNNIPVDVVIATIDTISTKKNVIIYGSQVNMTLLTLTLRYLTTSVKNIAPIGIDIDLACTPKYIIKTLLSDEESKLARQQEIEVFMASNPRQMLARYEDLMSVYNNAIIASELIRDKTPEQLRQIQQVKNDLNNVRNEYNTLKTKIERIEEGNTEEDLSIIQQIINRYNEIKLEAIEQLLLEANPNFNEKQLDQILSDNNINGTLTATEINNKLKRKGIKFNFSDEDIIGLTDYTILRGPNLLLKYYVELDNLNSYVTKVPLINVDDVYYSSFRNTLILVKEFPVIDKVNHWFLKLFDSRQLNYLVIITDSIVQEGYESEPFLKSYFRSNNWGRFIGAYEAGSREDMEKRLRGFSLFGFLVYPKDENERYEIIEEQPGFLWKLIGYKATTRKGPRKPTGTIMIWKSKFLP